MPRRLINPANALTLSRFVAAPVMLYLVLQLRSPSSADGIARVPLAMLVLMLVTILTDLFDGMVARAYRVVTNFGKIMDPVADSTFFMTLLFAMSANERFRGFFPIWFPLFVLWREVAMQVLRRYGALSGKVLAAKVSGKVKMVIQSVAMTSFLVFLCVADSGLLRVPETCLQHYLFLCGIVVVLVNLLSLIEYLRDVPDLIEEWNDMPSSPPPGHSS